MELFSFSRDYRLLTISIEYITSHENFETSILSADFDLGINFDDQVNSLLSKNSISIDDVVSISTTSRKYYINPNHYGKSFKVVGED